MSFVKLNLVLKTDRQTNQPNYRSDLPSLKINFLVQNVTIRVRMEGVSSTNFMSLSGMKGGVRTKRLTWSMSPSILSFKLTNDFATLAANLTSLS